jgi:TPR repeat protein
MRSRSVVQIGLALGWVLFGVSGQIASADESWTEKCRKLAGAPSEPGNRDGGTALDRIDPEQAVPACQRAVAEHASKVNFYRLGRALYKAQDYSGSVSSYLRAAGWEYAPAQNNLGAMYHNGKGVAQDDAEAARWYRKAAEQGYVIAQSNLGGMYYRGVGVGQDYVEAAQWYRKAAEQGHAGAQNNLGWMYENGRGVGQDHAQAARWYRKAAEQGEAYAQSNLGWAYENGQGVGQDYAEATRWYRKAAEQGEAHAQNNLGRMYEKGLGVPADSKKAAEYYSLASRSTDNEIAKRAREALDLLTGKSFPTVGYSNPEFFQAIYEGRTEGVRVSQVGFYLTAFLSMFTNADIRECRNVVGKATLYRIAGAGSADVLGQILGGLVQAHRSQGGSRDDLFGQGFSAGAGSFGGMMLSEASAQADAQLFYDRHGCNSAVANRFFGNISKFASQG